MQDVRDIVGRIVNYLKDHPEELLRALRNAVALRVGVPMAALKFAAGKAKGKKAPKDIQIDAVPPGVRLSATVDLMGTAVRASAIVFIESVNLDATQLRFEIRLADVSLKVLDENAVTPIAALLKSGALDLSKPGNLAAYMPKRPAILVEAKDDRIVVDLMKHPKLLDGRAKRMVEVIAPLVTVSGIRTELDHLDVALRPFPAGVREALTAVKRRVF